MIVKSMQWALGVGLGLLLTACGTQQINPVSGKQERVVMDERQEIELGRQLHEEMLKEYGVLQNPALQAYVNNIGQRLAKESHRAHLQWTFTVLDSPEVNAFALPGGYVYITRGIIAYLDSEAELAGVIGHEIGHVTARHGAQRATRQQTAGLGVFAASVLGAVLESKGVSGVGQLASDVSQNVAAGYVASYSRDQELQADELGAQYLSRTQDNPENMVDVIGVLKAQDRFAQDRARAAGEEVKEGSSWLASHPSSDQRLAQIRQTAQRYKQEGSVYQDDGRERYLKAIAGMPFGESADQGLTRGQQFYHADLGIALTAPQGWKINNRPDSIQVIQGRGEAALIVKLLPKEVGSNHREILQNGLKAAQGQTQSRNLNGLTATHFAGTLQSSQGQPTQARLTLVSGPNNSTYVLQYAAQNAQALQANLTGLEAVERSFRPMSNADRQAARPWTLQVVPMPAGGFAQLARESALDANVEAQLRLINSSYGANRPIRTGEAVKVVR